MLAISTIQNSNEAEDDGENIKMSEVKLKTKEFEFIDDTQIKELTKQAKTKYQAKTK